MFGLRNELFGFPVNSCDYEAIDCNKSYIPILNRDNDNEFVWSLGDPLEGGIDAANVSFSTKDIQKRPASVTKVDQALDALVDMIDASKSTIKSFTFALNQDGETLEGTITYEDDSGSEYTKTASINIKDIVEGWQVLTLKDIIADSIEADEGIFESAKAGGLDVTGDAVIEGNETVNGTVVMNSTLDVAGKATINGGADITGNLNVLEDSESHEGGEIHSKSLETTEDATIGGDLSVTGDAGISGNITSTGNASIGGTLSVVSTANIGSNLTVGGNTEISGDTTIGGDTTINGITTVTEDLNIGGDITVTDDLIVNGTTHLNVLETTGSAAIGGNLNVDGSIAGGSSLVVENQIESGSIVTTNTVTDNLTVNGNIALGNNATAPDFVLQSEKGEPNGVCPLNASGKVDTQYLPDVFTTAIVKVGTGIFSNSDTSVVVDSSITADSFVIISNYSDIIGDLNEVINVGQLTVVSNQTETGSYKYIIVNPLPVNP